MTGKRGNLFIIFLLVIISVLLILSARFSPSYIIQPRVTPTASPLPSIFPIAEIHHVVFVYDGDTIRIETGQKVRLLGIDAPEYDQELGQEANFFLRNLVLGKEVRLEYDLEKYDKYGRLLCYIFLDTVFVNEEIIKKGFAKTLFIPDNAKLKYRDRLINAENYAKEQKIGMWNI